MKKLCVIVSTYNGSKFFHEQLKSILGQKNVELDIYIRDDGSDSKMVELLQEYTKIENVHVLLGTNMGYVKSFMYMLYHVPDEYDYYAFCDQDDVWLPDKLNSAILKMNEYIQEPCFYFSSLTYVDEMLNYIGKKTYDKMTIDFGSAIVRNRISGCSVVINKKLLDISKKVEWDNLEIGSHDSWFYRLCLFVGGKIIYDDKSYILYRQHGNNVTGLKQGWKRRVKAEWDNVFVKSGWRYKIVVLLNQVYGKSIAKDCVEEVKQILNYRDNINCKVKLLFNKKVNSGILVVDVLKNIAIILNKF